MSSTLLPDWPYSCSPRQRYRGSSSKGRSSRRRAARVNIHLRRFVGECGGCDIDFGKELKVDEIAWINVQKISTLILNLNVYMADVAASKMTFVHSVDMRGDTDESWARSMNIIIKNYLLPQKGL